MFEVLSCEFFVHLGGKQALGWLKFRKSWLWSCWSCLQNYEMRIKWRLWQLKLAHLALIYAIHGRDYIYKNARKESLLSLLYEYKCRCIYQRKKEEGTPQSRGVDDGGTCRSIVFDFYILHCCCNFYYLSMLLVLYILWNYSPCYILVVVALAM